MLTPLLLRIYLLLADTFCVPSDCFNLLTLRSFCECSLTSLTFRSPADAVDLLLTY